MPKLAQSNARRLESNGLRSLARVGRQTDMERHFEILKFEVRAYS